MRKRREFESAVENERPTMIRQLRYRVDAETAEDVVQDALVVALTTDAWEDIRCVQSWLWGVVKNVLRNYNRKARDHVSLEKLTALVDSDYGDASKVGADNMTVIEDTLGRIIEDEKHDEQVCEILALAGRADLTPKEHAVLMGRIQGQDYREIAETLGIGENAVRSYLSLAVIKIRGCGTGSRAAAEPAPPH